MTVPVCSDFQVPDWNAPLDVQAALSAIPLEATAKGIFFHTALKMAEERTGLPASDKKYSAMRSYPSAELARVLVACAEKAFPGVQLRKALRLMGQQVFPSLQSTQLGGMIFGLVGRDLTAAFKLVGRAYRAFSTTRADLKLLDQNNALIELRNVWTFPEAYHVGVFEGAGQVYGHNLAITMRTQSLCDVDLKIYYT